MLTEELCDLTAQIRELQSETQTIEVKAAHIACPKHLYDTLSAFSNQDGGGMILFGLDENRGFAPVGVYDLQDLQQKVTEQCNQMEPPVRAIFTFAQTEGCAVCSAEIPGLDLAERPCYYKGSGRIKGSYIRVGDADLPMTDYELYGFESFRKHLRDDERPVPRADISMLDSEKLERFLLQMRTDRPGFSRLTREQALDMTAITRNGVPTLAAVLNFCIFPQGYFPQLAITAVAVPGTAVGDLNADRSRFSDNKRIEGTLPDMLQEAIAFCKRNMKVKTVIDPATGARCDRTEYPVAAIREAVLNALIHRDYSHFTEGTSIQLALFSDRLEIRSPGSLYGRMTVDQLGYARPDLRNPALATMAEFLLQTENRYSGIPTMRREMAAAGLPAPVFENRRSEFAVTFYNQPFSESNESAARDEAKDLLQFCRTPRSRGEIASFLGLSTSYYAMHRYVYPLLESGKLAATIPENPHSRAQKYVTVK